MGDVLKKVRPRQPVRIPAATFNTFIDAARDFLNRSHGIHRVPLAPMPADTGLVLVRNDSGATVDRFGILGVDSIVISPIDNLDEFKNHPVLSVVAPVVPDHSQNFVILAEPLAHVEAVADRTIGTAVIDGLAVVQVDVQNADHEFAVVVNAQSTKLKSAVSGPAQIIYKESGTGDKWAVVRLGGREGDFTTPASILPATHEGSETAQTDTWDRANPPSGKTGVEAKLCMRVVYNDAGDEKLYAFHRVFTWDSFGALVSISAETRYVVDEPVECICTPPV